MEWLSVASVDPWEAREVESWHLFVGEKTLGPEAGVDGQVREARVCPRMRKNTPERPGERLSETVVGWDRKRAEERRQRWPAGCRASLQHLSQLEGPQRIDSGKSDVG